MNYWIIGFMERYPAIHLRLPQKVVGQASCLPEGVRDGLVFKRNMQAGSLRHYTAAPFAESSFIHQSTNPMIPASP
jgi:hypothetical protein